MRCWVERCFEGSVYEGLGSHTFCCGGLGIDVGKRIMDHGERHACDLFLSGVIAVGLGNC